MDTKQGVLDILNDLTGEDLSDQMDENIFDNGLMDSMASVQMLLNLQEKFDIDVPVSEFNREVGRILTTHLNHRMARSHLQKLRASLCCP